MRLSTKQKIAIARVISAAVLAGRRLVHAGERLQCVRESVRWQLDLGEGIDLAIYLKRYERAEMRAISQYVEAGATVLDIGANVGFHTLLMAKKVGNSGRVIAIEPTSYAFAKLGANIRLNPSLADRIQPYQILLVDGLDARPHSQEIYSSWPLIGNAKVHPSHLGRAMPIDGARILALDALWAEGCFEKVDFIKLDVDGNEAAVLRGARGLLSREKPKIMLELAPGAHEGSGFEDMLSELAQAGYRLTHLTNGEVFPLDSVSLRARNRSDITNVLATTS